MDTTHEIPPTEPRAPGVPDDRRGQRDAGTRQFVTFQVESEHFALPMAVVREIIRMPRVVRVPMSPPTLEGLANLRGAVLPVVNLRRRFGFADRAGDDATRVVVLDQGGLVGLVVDRVSSVVTVEPEQLEPLAGGETAVDGDFLTAMLKQAGGQDMTMVLDPARLLHLDLGAAARAARQAADGDGESRVHEAAGAATDERQLVSFVVADEEYAFPVDRVQEIVQVPEHVSRMPNAAPHVLGVMTLRNRLLPLVSLRIMFGMPQPALTSQQRLVVISLSSGHHDQARGLVGIVMDAVNEVLRVPARLIDELPQYLTEGQQLREVEAVCRLNEGARLVSVLSVDRLVAHGLSEAMRFDAEEQGMATDDGARTDRRLDEEEQLVVFRLADEEYGVRIDAVQEIIRVPDTVTRVPNAPASLEGLINLRGQVLPVLDLRRRFSLASVAREDRQRIVVFALDGVHAGFIVDSVSEVLKIARATVRPMPGRSESEGGAMAGVANLEAAHRMILILDARALLDDGEVRAARAAAETRGSA